MTARVIGPSPGSVIHLIAQSRDVCQHRGGSHRDGPSIRAASTTQHASRSTSGRDGLRSLRRAGRDVLVATAAVGRAMAALLARTERLPSFARLAGARAGRERGAAGERGRRSGAAAGRSQKPTDLVAQQDRAAHRRCVKRRMRSLTAQTRSTETRLATLATLPAASTGPRATSIQRSRARSRAGRSAGSRGMSESKRSTLRSTMCATIS